MGHRCFERTFSASCHRGLTACAWILARRGCTASDGMFSFKSLIRPKCKTAQLVTYAMYNLCKHPEYLQPLRTEVNAMSRKDLCDTTSESLPLLDSFLRETGRYFPLSACKYILIVIPSVATEHLPLISISIWEEESSQRLYICQWGTCSCWELRWNFATSSHAGLRELRKSKHF